jgi:hypothetical protein
MTQEEVTVVEEAPVEEPTKSSREVAEEVIAGHWGRGLTRKRRLQDAGYDVAEVSEEIKNIFNQ